MIERIIDFIGSLVTYRPISSITVLELMYLYIQYTILGFICLIPFLWIKRKKELPSIRDIFVGIPVEDLIFRWIPIRFIGPQAGIYAHVIWALLHGFPSFMFVVFNGLLMLRLWLGGLWMEAIFIHLFHDILWISIANIFSKNKNNEEI